MVNGVPQPEIVVIGSAKEKIVSKQGPVQISLTNIIPLEELHADPVKKSNAVEILSLEAVVTADQPCRILVVHGNVEQFTAENIICEDGKAERLNLTSIIKDSDTSKLNCCIYDSFAQTVGTTSFPFGIYLTKVQGLGQLKYKYEVGPGELIQPQGELSLLVIFNNSKELENRDVQVTWKLKYRVGWSMTGKGQRRAMPLNHAEDRVFSTALKAIAGKEKVVNHKLQQAAKKSGLKKKGKKDKKKKSGKKGKTGKKKGKNGKGKGKKVKKNKQISLSKLFK